MHLLRKPHARIRNGCYAWEMHAELLNERQRGCRKTVWLTASLPTSQLHQILSKGDNWGRRRWPRRQSGPKEICLGS